MNEERERERKLYDVAVEICLTPPLDGYKIWLGDLLHCRESNKINGKHRTMLQELLKHNIFMYMRKKYFAMINIQFDCDTFMDQSYRTVPCEFKHNSCLLNVDSSRAFTILKYCTNRIMIDIRSQFVTTCDCDLQWNV